MRESFGGAFMIKLVLVFIVIYVSFMAVAINYAKAFRIKNHIINILEQNQYRSSDNIDTLVDDYLKAVAYNVSDVDCPNGSKKFNRGICVEPHEQNGEAYYTVTTFISVDFPFFQIHMTLPVRGETKTIVY